MSKAERLDQEALANDRLAGVRPDWVKGCSSLGRLRFAVLDGTYDPAKPLFELERMRRLIKAGGG